MATRLLCVCVWYLKIDYSIFRRLFALFLYGRSRVNWWLLNVSLSKYIHNTYTDVCVCTTVMGILSLYKSVQPTISILTDKQTNRTHTTVRNELRFSTEAAMTPDDAMLVACVHQETMRESRKCTPQRSLSLSHTLCVSMCLSLVSALSLSLSLFATRVCALLPLVQWHQHAPQQQWLAGRKLSKDMPGSTWQPPIG